MNACMHAFMQAGRHARMHASKHACTQRTCARMCLRACLACASAVCVERPPERPPGGAHGREPSAEWVFGRSGLISVKIFWLSNFKTFFFSFTLIVFQKSTGKTKKIVYISRASGTLIRIVEWSTPGMMN